MMERMQHHLSYITKYAQLAYSNTMNCDSDKLDGVRKVLATSTLFYARVLMLEKALTRTYGDLLVFCRETKRVFVGKSGKGTCAYITSNT
jgi:hypothetical protein